MTTQDHPIEVGFAHSAALDKLAPAFVEVQKHVRTAQKNAQNPHFRNRYADLGETWEACREALAGGGFSLLQPTDVRSDGRVVLVTLLLHASGQWIRGTYLLNPVKQDPQSLGSALTYARRYSLASMVGVVADDDDDGARASTPSRQQQSPPQMSGPNGYGDRGSYYGPQNDPPPQDNFPPSYGEPQQAPQQQGALMPGPSPQNDNPTTRRLWGLILDAQSTQLIEAAVAQAMHELGGQSAAFQELRTYAKAKFEHLASIEDSAPPDNSPNPLDVADAAE